MYVNLRNVEVVERYFFFFFFKVILGSKFENKPIGSTILVINQRFSISSPK